jgi:integrase
MSPGRTGKGRGRLRFNRVFPAPVGRIHKSSGAKTLREFRKREAILDELLENDQTDVLLAFKRGRKKGGLDMADLIQAKRKKRLASASLMADIKLKARLWDRNEKERGAVTTTIAAMRCAQTTKDRYTVAFHQLAAIAAESLPPDATVEQLAAVPWETILDAWDVAPATRNRIRSAVSAFLSRFLGDKYHPFRRDIVKSIPLYEEPTDDPKSITVPEFWQLMDAEAMPEPAVASYVTMGASGLRAGEYLWADRVRRVFLTTEDDEEIEVLEIRFRKGKTGSGVAYASVEYEAYVRAAVPCRIAKAPAEPGKIQNDARYKRLRKFLSDASDETGIEVTIHYLRHLFAQTGADVAPQSDVQRALRHKTSKMTERYTSRKIRGNVAVAVGNRLKRKIS